MTQIFRNAPDGPEGKVVTSYAVTKRRWFLRYTWGSDGYRYICRLVIRLAVRFSRTESRKHGHRFGHCATY